MRVDIVVPAFGESVTEATVSKWMKEAGDAVQLHEPLLELETEKVTVEVYAAAAGMLAEVHAPAGSVVGVGAILGLIAGGATSTKVSALASTSPRHVGPPELKPVSSPSGASTHDKQRGDIQGKGQQAPDAIMAVPLSAERTPLPATALPAIRQGGGAVGSAAIATIHIPAKESLEREERVPMSRLRRKIAERLKHAQNTAAILTTFNEIDMSRILAARETYRDQFQKRHGIKLGFMSFFVKAVIVALDEVPALNAEIDGDHIIYKRHYDIGVAVGGAQGLVVPVLRNADQMSFAEIEKKIAWFGERARAGKLAIEELSGGTFSISNGGVYGSMLSTPILNPPQSGILGMHKTTMRPVAIDGRVEVRPMMYIALSYDHRIVDGREAITALLRVKECIEDPARIMFEV